MAEAAPGPDSITHARVLTIAGPIVLSNATIPILGAVDTGVVGQLGAAAPIGAVGLGAIILQAVYWIFGFLRMGTTGLAAQAAGAGNRAEVAALLTRVLMIGLAGGTVMIAAQSLLFAGAFRLAPASAEVEALARDYMGVRIWSAPAAIAIYGITGWLIAAERTRAVLVLQVGMNLLNMALSVWLVLGLDLGVEGAALGTVIAEWCGLALGLWLCRAAFGVPAWRDWPRVFDAHQLKRMGRVNGDILIRSALLQSIFVSFLFLASGMGDVTLAANQVLLQFLHVTAYALDGFAFAAEAMVGQAAGAGAVATLRRASLLSAFWGAVATLLLAAAFALGGGAIIELMAEAPEVVSEARRYLPWMVLAPVLGLASYMYDGIYIGATRTADMRNLMAVSAAGYFAAAALLIPVFGNHGLWAALMASFVFRGLTMAWRYPALERAVARGA
ncbi:multidrug resistance protein, MATE family [Roseivivax lentus]|uniref:Multidrug resistance protein, MATE family n=1 Tax=Roseivivax lentus TaxID=633194 RepID=A0A1N7PEE3_9RHOB|nr:MATE family efflux transporter [Roseivivax lentus]SIT08961.1 multidrug resistance protein, MATE family [Roseivivax lentus]